MRSFEVSRFRGFEVSRFRGFEALRFRGFEASRFGGFQVSRFRGRGFEVSRPRFRGFEAEVSRFRGFDVFAVFGKSIARSDLKVVTVTGMGPLAVAIFETAVTFDPSHGDWGSPNRHPRKLSSTLKPHVVSS